MPFSWSFTLPQTDLEYKLRGGQLNFMQQNLQSALLAYEKDNFAHVDFYLSECIRCTRYPDLFGIPMPFKDENRNILEYSMLDFCIDIRSAHYIKECLLNDADPFYQYQYRNPRTAHPSALKTATDAVLDYLEMYKEKCEKAGQETVEETDFDVAVFKVFSLLLGQAHDMFTAQPKKYEKNKGDYDAAVNVWQQLPSYRRDRAVADSTAETKIDAEESEENRGLRFRRTSSSISNESLESDIQTETTDISPLLPGPPKNTSSGESTGVLSTITSVLTCFKLDVASHYKKKEANPSKED